MAKKLLYNGKEYPLQFNFLVFQNWEKETGKKLSDLGALAEETGAVEVVTILTLLFYAVLDACEEKEVDFPFTLRQFIRGVDMTKVDEMAKLIDLTEGEGLENNGQPKAEMASE